MATLSCWVAGEDFRGHMGSQALHVAVINHADGAALLRLTNVGVATGRHRGNRNRRFATTGLPDVGQCDKRAAAFEVDAWLRSA